MKKQRHTKKFTVIASIAVRQCVRNLFAMENDNAKMFSGCLKEKNSVIASRYEITAWQSS